MKLFSSKALLSEFKSKMFLDALGAVGSIAVLGITSSAFATGAVSAGTSTIPLELVSNGGVATITNSSNPITYTPNAGLSSGTVIVNVSGATVSSGTYYMLLNGSSSVCSASSASSTTSLTFNGCTLTSGSNYEISTSSAGYAGITFTANSGSSIVVSINSIAGSGSATLFNPSQELSFSQPSLSTYTIATNQTTFTNNGSNSAINSISMTDNYNNSTWSGYIKSGTINFAFSGIPGSVSTVSGSSNGTSISFGSSSNSTTPSSGSANLSISFSGLSTSPGSGVYSFNFINSGNITTGTIQVSVSGTNLAGGGNISTSTQGSYQYLNSTSFITFANQTVSIYGELVYLNSTATSTYNEELRLVLPQSISASNVSISVGGTSCGTLDKYIYPSTVSLNNQTIYNVNVFQLFSSCVNNSSYDNGDLVPIQITLPATANISQVSGVAMAWGGGISKRLPLNVVQGQPSQLGY